MARSCWETPMRMATDTMHRAVAAMSGAAQLAPKS